MPNTEERLASLEARVDRVNDLFALITDLRADMHRQFGDVNRQFGEVTRRIDGLDQRVDRDFRWLVGIQMTVMLTVIGLLVGAMYR